MNCTRQGKWYADAIRKTSVMALLEGPALEYENVELMDGDI